MKKSTQRKLLSYFLASTLILSACGKKSECNIPTRHVHKYVKQINDNINIEEYLDNEHLKVHGYDWTEEYIEINKQDEKLYKLLNSKMLFDGIRNWDYLFNKMANNHDYLEFYYHYTTTETYTTIDEDGHIQMHTRTVDHSGWTDDPNYSHNTGRVRLCHHRYFGYKIMNTDNKYKLKRSNAVDDIREIIDEYAYFGEKCTEIVDKEFEFNTSKLPYLSPNDFDVFKGPDLTTNKVYTLTRTNNN